MMQEICGRVRDGWVCASYPGHTGACGMHAISNRHTRAVHDTSREIASAAGLALWVNDVWGGCGLRIVNDEYPIAGRVADFIECVGEAPNAD